MMILLSLCPVVAGGKAAQAALPDVAPPAPAQIEPIRWVDFSVPYEVLVRCYELAVKYHFDETVPFDFTQALAYLAAKNGNRFSVADDRRRLDGLVAELNEGGSIPSLAAGLKYYHYYEQCYNAVFENMLGEYDDEAGNRRFGLTACFPLAAGYWYNHYDDFGNARTFGFKRRHLGHDIMGSVGTPVMAVEGGTVVECGWNRYGGWRVGILSGDGRRYYYYAHLRKDKPFADGIEKGAVVEAGRHIGYLGVTGYSDRENVNMQTKPHLHFGLQLIFDESQRKGSKEIWIDCYALCLFLSRNRAVVPNA